MWSQFALAVLFCAIAVYVPGFVQLKSLRFASATSLIFAPVVSIVELVAFGIVFGVCGIPVSSWIVILCPFALSAALLASRVLTRARWTASRSDQRKVLGDFGISWRWLSLYVGIGTVVSVVLFVLPLEGPDSYAQLYDNAFHINLIKTFSETSRYSVLQASLYPTLPLAPLSNMTFYPAAWHVVAALVSNAINASPAMAENAVNFVFVAWFFPSSACVFVSTVFREEESVIPFGSVLTPAFAAFPWGFLAVGPLYSNFSAFVVVPLVVAAFVMLLHVNDASKKKSFALLFVFSAVCAALSQPNSIFTCAVVLAPFCVAAFYSFARRKFSQGKTLALSFALVLIAVVVWMVLWSSSAFSGVVGNPYHPYTVPVQAVIDYLDWGFRNASAQPLLTFFVALGMLYCLGKQRHRWLLVAYAFFGIAYLSGGGIGDDVWGSVLTGFWYNDVDRIAACAMLAALPIASCGLYTLCCAVQKVICAVTETHNSSMIPVVTATMLSLILFMPNYILAGNGNVSTGMGERFGRFMDISTKMKYYTQEEKAFAEKCMSIVGDDLVVNFSFDGSVFAYQENDMNVLFKHYTPSGAGDRAAIRLSLDEIETNEEVRRAVRNTGAKYVLLLDDGHSADRSVYEEFLTEDDWRGILDIDRDTPGFELVLSEGDMRLYKIADEYTE